MLLHNSFNIADINLFIRSITPVKKVSKRFFLV